MAQIKINLALTRKPTRENTLELNNNNFLDQRALFWNQRQSKQIECRNFFMLRSWNKYKYSCPSTAMAREAEALSELWVAAV